MPEGIRKLFVLAREAENHRGDLIGLRGLTLVIVIDSHVPRRGVHELVGLGGQRRLVARRQKAALLLQLSD